MQNFKNIHNGQSVSYDKIERKNEFETPFLVLHLFEFINLFTRNFYSKTNKFILIQIHSRVTD